MRASLRCVAERCLRGGDDPGRHQPRALADPADDAASGRGAIRRAAASTGPSPRTLELEIWSAEEALLGAANRPGLPAWDLCFVAGEIGEVFLHTSETELRPGAPLVMSGKFTSGLVFQATFLPHQAECALAGFDRHHGGTGDFDFPHGWPGPVAIPLDR